MRTDFAALNVGALPEKFHSIRLSENGTPSFHLAAIGGRVALTESNGKPGDILYSKTAMKNSIYESYSFVYSGPSSVVEPYLVNANDESLRSGYATNLSVSAPNNVSAGKEFYQYFDSNEKKQIDVKGRLRTQPFYYRVGHTYRVDLIADPQSMEFSTRVYDILLGPGAFDQSIKVITHALNVYPGLLNPSGGPVEVLDFAFGPASGPAVIPHIPARAFDYINYLGYNAGINGTSTSPASLAFQKLFPLLGILHVRVPAESSFLPTINSVSKYGINADVLSGNKTTLAVLKQFIARLKNAPDSIELWNEPNNPNEGGAYDSRFAFDLPLFARQVRAAFPGENIWGPSILPDLNGYPTVAQNLSPSLATLITAWNSHPYTLGTPENMGYGGFIAGACGVTKKEDCGWYGSATWNDNVSSVLNPELPGVLSEGAASYGSYPAICGHSNVSLDAQQAYLQRGMLYNFKLGHKRIYPYKFIDDGKCSDGFGTYGIISRLLGLNGTITFSPKPAYTALAYLNHIIRDDGARAATFDPKPLQYSISSASGDLEELLLAESDGSYRLVLWSDMPLWDFNVNGTKRVGASLSLLSRQVTVNFDTVAKLTVYNQSLGTGAWDGSVAITSSKVKLTINQLPTVLDIRIGERQPSSAAFLLPSGVPTPGPTETPTTQVIPR